MIQAVRQAEVVRPLPPALHVYYLPRAGLSDRTNNLKADGDHCSNKAVNGGFFVGGLRTPFCYPLVQGLVEMMCDSA